MTQIEKLMSTRKPFLTDGGFETWLFFIEGFKAPEFAAIVLLDDDAARQKMREYFDRFLDMADRASTGFVLDTNTWRGCVEWAPKLGLDRQELLRLSRDAVRFAKSVREPWAILVDPILINGVIGPAGDGYSAQDGPDENEAERVHQPQIDIFADEGVDMVSGLTMTNTPEAIGIVRAAANRNLPSVVSFTVETDGRLPSGEALVDAIGRTDAATDGAPLYYMINCAHPDHFRTVIDDGESWLQRLGGLRANASRLSHAELDEAETLDDGNPEEFGQLHLHVAERLPMLRVVGGCCGTDDRHIDCVSHHLHHQHAA